MVNVSDANYMTKLNCPEAFPSTDAPVRQRYAKDLLFTVRLLKLTEEYSDVIQYRLCAITHVQYTNELTWRYDYATYDDVYDELYNLLVVDDFELAFSEDYKSLNLKTPDKTYVLNGLTSPSPYTMVDHLVFVTTKREIAALNREAAALRHLNKMLEKKLAQYGVAWVSLREPDIVEEGAVVPGNLTVAGDLTVPGNLTVAGNFTM
jgi:hypothetical protein